MIWFVFAACVIAMVLADVRWLRVAQREHYLAGTVSRFVSRWWWQSGFVNRCLLGLAIVGLVMGVIFPSAVLMIAISVAIGPMGLSLRGRTSKLAFTRRLKTLAGILLTLQVLILALAVAINAGFATFVAGLLAMLAPTATDIAMAIAAPWERRQAEPFVRAARARLKSVSPTVIGITGSYGKTTTKNYVAHLLSGSLTAMATPASFNNRAGLSRAINEQLAPGTDVFIAEMGTYGPGEIAELCEFCPPAIAVLTSIGPVHLERFGTEDAIVEAKSEIFKSANICILNTDDERLAAKADELEAIGKTVWRCSALDGDADVCVQVVDEVAYIYRNGDLIIEGVAIDAPPTNVACAVAVALCLNVEPQAIADRLAALPVVAHRQEVTVKDDGPIIIDDTYNANPASVRRALEVLARVAPEQARRVVATPGMVELGRRQPAENYSFARDAGDAATDIIVIGRTNRRALLDGANAGGLNVITVDHLPEAVEWVRKNTGTGDAVLYVNDLPDHFP